MPKENHAQGKAWHGQIPFKKLFGNILLKTRMIGYWMKNSFWTGMKAVKQDQ